MSFAVGSNLATMHQMAMTSMVLESRHLITVWQLPLVVQKVHVSNKLSLPHCAELSVGSI